MEKDTDALNVRPDAESLSDEQKSFILEQYKVYVETAERVSNRRQSSNTFHLTLVTTLFGVLALGVKIDVSNEISDGLWSFVPLLGSAICLIWFSTLRTYRDLNSTKFKVIEQIERILPVDPFSAEWKIVKQKATSRGYSTFHRVERHVPLMFLITFLGLWIANLGWFWAVICGSEG